MDDPMKKPGMVGMGDTGMDDTEGEEKGSMPMGGGEGMEEDDEEETETTPGQM